MERMKKKIPGGMTPGIFAVWLAVNYRAARSDSLIANHSAIQIHRLTADVARRIGS